MSSTRQTPRNPMTARERRATLGLASVFSMRMLGLFLVLPVFALYAHELAGATPMMIGLAIGAYGLTQALLQIPLGMASDRWGRRPVIVAGLLLFALGSVVAALSESIYGVIAGRALQGTGAVAAAAMAMAADLTRDSQRTKIMAVIGISIGFSFLLALMLGPVIAGWWGLSGVFWFTAVMALAGIGVMYLLVPTPEQAPARRVWLCRSKGGYGPCLKSRTCFGWTVGFSYCI
ncbi:MFS transporter [Alkalilimnicola ehrlichii]|uniref:MFS transporter n=1 Tax=Alkalilimnicola ehrlichii TaxID=351052 RepID=UPI0021612FA3|nr:MFS transporter [Alkalilimnicola ehrlichii]